MIYACSLLLNCAISLLNLLSITLAYICVVVSLLCPNSLLTVSIGTPLVNVTVVANVCRAKSKRLDNGQ